MKKEESEFKKKVQARLKQVGKTQKQLATVLDLSDSAMSHLLSRGTNDPDIMKIIAQFLNFDMSFLNTNSQIKTSDSSFQQVDKETTEKIEHLKELIKAKDETIKAKDETIEVLRQQVKN